MKNPTLNDRTYLKDFHIPYRDQLLELGKLYKVNELRVYAKSQKTMQIHCRQANYTNSQEIHEILRNLGKFFCWNFQLLNTPQHKFTKPPIGKYRTGAGAENVVFKKMF